MTRLVFFVAKLLAVLIILFFGAVVLTIDLVALEQLEIVAGVVTWLILFGLILKAEQDVKSRLVICTVRMG